MALTVLIIMGALVAIGMIAVLIHRFLSARAPGNEHSSMTRPILALLLVGTLILLAVVTITGKDADSRHSLVGGVISLSSAAAGYYFAATAGAEARDEAVAVNVES